MIGSHEILTNYGIKNRVFMKKVHYIEYKITDLLKFE